MTVARKRKAMRVTRSRKSMRVNRKNPSNGSRKRVAVACQGGGSKTAFTAGVLQGLMDSVPDDVELVALSGTSGGALCAALAWDGLVRNDPKLAIRKLQGFWESMAASDPLDKLANQMVMNVMSLRDLMVLPEVSPYHLPTWGEQRFRDVLNEFFDFDEMRTLARRPGAPALRIGAVEVLTGHFELFSGEDLCAETLLASAAIPEMFRAVTVAERGVFWDGLFSQNPPIHDLIELQIDELWLIQINASTCVRVPTETHEILDRRNELSGNLSMEQELGFIEVINRAIAKGVLTDPKYRPIQVARIALDRDLDYRSKMDRRPELLEELRMQGQTKWRWFLKDRQSRLESTV
jgi:NTE family protein